ncbi:hypothetical protein JCM9140_3593 [Halalkalibacter wakoensis JCM 9140]|uniref:Uncharacterized protein n=1 Tax=Halalkalibacter wakoensis JCM 9140 TaxID=1236970 RepID=W4Q5W2_9BACI|nr:hypothetical protein [Halalkalibacter wakoensis]GAE27446.1 hypothetical protein JCM9140_3593 [Halalkalibacter wakoensis JCM 9140]
MGIFQINPLQIECTMFFQENPYTYETVKGLAIRLGRNTEDLVGVLEYLVSSMVLEVIGTGENAIYRYIQPVTIGLQKEETWEEM